MAELKSFQNHIDGLNISQNIIVVFDLDYTLWPFWIDTHVRPPFQKKKDKIVDEAGSQVDFYKHSTDILKILSVHPKIEVGVASRTSEIEGAYNLLNVNEWEKYIKYTQIFPGCKVKHITNISRDSGIDFRHIVFFDDEQRNITDVSQKLGSYCVMVTGGVTFSLVVKGLQAILKQLQT